MDDLYLWLKALHIMAVIAWMAGLFYLPRLMVYHTTVEVGSNQSELFKVMERRLLKAITTPAMIAAWGLGLWIAIDMGYFSDGWFHAKLALVLILTGYHGLLARYVRLFAQDSNTKSEKFYRIINEIPTLLMIGIVILVIFKPF